MSTEAQEHLLISRVVDGDASEQDWQDLETFAMREPRIWRDLAEAQRDHAALMRGVSSALALADATPLPSLREAFMAGGSHERFQQRLHRLSAWAGWAVAAVLVLALTPLGRNLNPSKSVNQTGIGSAFTVNNADDAYKAYIDLGKKDGRVLNEVPERVMLQSNPLPGGHGFEIVFIRQIKEKITVPDLYQFAGEDERGQPTLVRMQITARGSM